MSVEQRCPSYRESNTASKKKAGTNSRCPFNKGVVSYRESNKASKERQGPALDVCRTEVSPLERVK